MSYKIINFKKYQIFKVNVKDFQCVHNGKYIVIVEGSSYNSEYYKNDMYYDYFYKVLENEEVIYDLKKLKREDLKLSNEIYGFCNDSIFSNSLSLICHLRPTKKN